MMQAGDSDCDGAVKRCEREKVTIAKEVQRLKEEMLEHRLEDLEGIDWRDSLQVFNNAEKDLLSNINQSAELKAMRAEVQRELNLLSQQASQLKKQILSGEESEASRSTKTRQLSDQYAEKKEVEQKIEGALRGHSNQRGLILDALKNVCKSLVRKLYEKKINYCDLKFNMCSFLQEYHKLKKRNQETETRLRQLIDSSTCATPTSKGGHLDIGANRSLKDLLNDIDSLAQKKLSAFGVKSVHDTPTDSHKKHGLESANTTPLILQSTSNLSNPAGSQSPPPAFSAKPLGLRLPNNGQHTPTKPRDSDTGKGMGIFKDRSLDISRNSHLSMKSVSKRYEANDDDDEQSSSSREDPLEEDNNIRGRHKFVGSYLDRSQGIGKSGISTPDKSLNRVRGISPIGQQKEGNSYFISPDR